jgi:hypothetical protein
MALSIFIRQLNNGSEFMAKSDPTKDSEFKRVLGNILNAKPKPHSEMKLGKRSAKKAKSPRQKRAERAKTKSAQRRVLVT